MSYLRNASLTTKMLGPIIGICVGGMACLGVMAYQLEMSDQRYSTFISDDLMGVQQLMEVRADVRSIAVEAYNLSVSDDNSGGRHDLRAQGEEIQGNFTRAAELLPADREEVAKFASIVDIYVSRQADVVDLAKSGDKEGARLKVLSMDAEGDKLDDDILDFINRLRAKIEAASDDLSAKNLWTLIYTVSCVAIFILLSIAAAVLIIRRSITSPLKVLMDRMASLSSGDTASPVDGMDRKDEIGEMARAVAIFRDNEEVKHKLEASAEQTRQTTEKERAERDAERRKQQAEMDFAIRSLGDALAHLAEGDLVNRLDQPFADNLDALRVNFNNSADRLLQTLRSVGFNASAINASAAEVRSATDDLAKRTSTQAAAVEETAAALEQITRAVSDSTERAEEAGQLVERTRKGAEQSGEIVRKAVEAIYQIEKSSGAIASIIGVIDEIAFQTNLLALNAGVEAARAGEAGRGFAVVAQEVRELAQRSATAAKEIKELILSSSSQVKAGVSLVDEAGRALSKMVSEVQEINLHVNAIVSSAHEQSNALKEINQAVTSMDQGTQKNASMVEETTATSHNLAGEANQLDEILRQFNLGSGMQKPVEASATSRPVPSPAHALNGRLAKAVGATGTDDAAGWKQF